MRGFARVAVAVPPAAVAAALDNARHTLELWRKAHEEGCHIVVFPELGLSAYTARDLFHNYHLLSACEEALFLLAEESKTLSPLALVGTPLRVGGSIYNVAVAIQNGRILGIVPKSYLPSYREFEEYRWFQPGTHVPNGSTARFAGEDIPFGTDLLFTAAPLHDLVVGIEICEDIWVQSPPSALLTSAGATVIANLSASNFTIGKADIRRVLCQSMSDRGKCAYLYVAAGPGESSTDLAFDADAFICDNGALLAESQRFSRQSQLIVSDVDLEQLQRERFSTGSFGDCAAHMLLGRTFRKISFSASELGGEVGSLKRQINKHPFLPKDPITLSKRMWEIFEIQTNALATRMKAIGKPKLILGLSGGLDSTHAALVAIGALQLTGQPVTDLHCITMPGLGTTSETKGNAVKLAEALGCRLSTMSVSEVSREVLSVVGHPAAAGAETVDDLLQNLRKNPAWGDTTLENVQARLRTLLLMTVANKENGLVVGTGDLSEKALGWCTYSGDHIAMYDVNAGVPKTLIQFVIRWVANERAQVWTGNGNGNGTDPTKDDEKTRLQILRETLYAILETPISPELLPPDAEGKIAQYTESAVGPYELHDFFLFYMVRQGKAPARILDLARHAFGNAYAPETLKKWMLTFTKRFFYNQWKRSCATDGPKVGMVALSPRGDWRMPSDAQVHSWVKEIEGWE